MRPFPLRFERAAPASFRSVHHCPPEMVEILDCTISSSRTVMGGCGANAPSEAIAVSILSGRSTTVTITVANIHGDDENRRRVSYVCGAEACNPAQCRRGIRFSP